MSSEALYRDPTFDEVLEEQIVTLQCAVCKKAQEHRCTIGASFPDCRKLDNGFELDEGE